MMSFKQRDAVQNEKMQPDGTCTIQKQMLIRCSGMEKKR